MIDFLKTMGQGILYTILSPFILLGVILFAVYSLFVFFFMFFKRIIMFFQGEDMSSEMRIDRAAKLHLNNQNEELDIKEEKEIVPLETKIVKEEKTTIVQPIIIQTDEEGRLKNIQYITPTPQVPNIEKNIVPQIEEQPLENKEEE